MGKENQTESTIRSLYNRGMDKCAIEASDRIDLAHKLQLRKLVRKLNPYWSDALVKEYVMEFQREQQ